MKIKAFLFVILTVITSTILTAETAKIIRMTGSQAGTVYLPDNTEVPATVGLEVPVGSLIEVGEGTKLFLETFEGQITVAEAGSVFQIEAMEVTPEKKEVTRINLKSGDLVANLDPNKRGTNDYGVRTPKGVAAARGTNYSVSVNGVTVLVTVSGGEVSFTIPGFPDPISLNPGQASTGDSPTAGSLAGVLLNPNTAAMARAALKATAAAVATLSTVPGSGVTAATLSGVIATAGEASEATGDASVIGEIAAAAAEANPATAEAVVTAAVRASPNSAAAVVTAVTNSVSQATAPATTTTTTTGTTTTTTTTAAKPTTAAVQALAQTLAAAANAAGSTVTVSATAITSSVQTTQATTPVATTVTTVTTSSGSSTTPTTTTPTTTTTTTTATETLTIEEVPVDNTVTQLFSTFTIRLSGGRLVAVTLNNINDTATVRVVDAVEGAQTAEIGNGAFAEFTVPAQVVAVVGAISPAQFASIAAGIRTALPGPTITVPNNTITVSPSS
jgi:hypothetical protein